MLPLHLGYRSSPLNLVKSFQPSQHKPNGRCLVVHILTHLQWLSVLSAGEKLELVDHEYELKAPR